MGKYDYSKAYCFVIHNNTNQKKLFGEGIEHPARVLSKWRQSERKKFQETGAYTHADASKIEDGRSPIFTLEKICDIPSSTKSEMRHKGMEVGQGYRNNQPHYNVDFKQSFRNPLETSKSTEFQEIDVPVVVEHPEPEPVEVKPVRKTKLHKTKETSTLASHFKEENPPCQHCGK